MMHWWNPRPLAAALHANSLSERQKYHYLLAAIVFRALVGSTAVFAAHANLGSLLVATLALLFSVIGISAAYRQNVAGDDRAFAERYLCLTVPILVQSYFAYLVLYYGSIVVTRMARGGDLRAASVVIAPYFGVASLGVVVFYFLQLRRFIARASGAHAI